MVSRRDEEWRLGEISLKLLERSVTLHGLSETASAPFQKLEEWVALV